MVAPRLLVIGRAQVPAPTHGDSCSEGFCIDGGSGGDSSGDSSGGGAGNGSNTASDGDGNGLLCPKQALELKQTPVDMTHPRMLELVAPYASLTAPAGGVLAQHVACGDDFLLLLVGRGAVLRDE